LFLKTLQSNRKTTKEIWPKREKRKEKTKEENSLPFFEGSLIDYLKSGVRSATHVTTFTQNKKQNNAI